MTASKSVTSPFPPSNVDELGFSGSPLEIRIKASSANLAVTLSCSTHGRGPVVENSKASTRQVSRAR